MTSISKRQRESFYILKSKKDCETFSYTNIQTLFKKHDNLRYGYIYIKQDTLRYKIFHENVKVRIYIQKAWYFALRDVLRYKYPDTSRKAR